MLLGLAVGLVIGALTQMVGCLLICCATYRRKLGVLKRSVIVCRLLLLTEISLAVLALFYQTTTRKETEQMADWRGFVFRYHRSARIHLQVDAIQTKLKCCGFSSYHDWEHNAYFACSSTTNGHCGVPTSCCKGQTPPWNCSVEIRSKASPDGREASDVINTRGCLDLFIAWTKYNLILLGFCCLFLACLLLILFSAVREFRSQVFLQETRTDQGELGVKPNDHDDPKTETMTKRESESDRCRSVVVRLQRNRDCEAFAISVKTFTVKLVSLDSVEKSQKMTAAGGKARTPHIRDVWKRFGLAKSFDASKVADRLPTVDRCIHRQPNGGATGQHYIVAGVHPGLESSRNLTIITGAREKNWQAFFPWHPRCVYFVTWKFVPSFYTHFTRARV